jgi:hypothetical protein
MWTTAEYKIRLHREAAALQQQHTARGGGRLKYLWNFGDLDGMYTNVTMQRMNDALRANIQRVKDSSDDDRRYPMRNLDRIAVGKSKQDGISACHLGPAYNAEEQVEIKFTDLTDICEYSNSHSIMRIGRQIRKYIILFIDYRTGAQVGVILTYVSSVPRDSSEDYAVKIGRRQHHTKSTS